MSARKTKKEALPVFPHPVALVQPMTRAYKVDWLSFTSRLPLTAVLAKFAGLSPQEKGLNGYTCSFSSLEGVKVLYSPGRDDVHVILPGAACAMYDFYDLLVIPDASDTISRLDIALDCVHADFTCQEIWGWLRQGCFVSPARSISAHQGLVHEAGFTIYVGKRGGERLLRIYDKQAEQGTLFPWVRLEIELRSAASHDVLRRLLSGSSLPSLGAGLIQSQLRLIHPLLWECVGETYRKHNTNKFPTASFWSRLFDDAPRIRLHLPLRNKSVQGMMRYVKNASASMVALRTCLSDYDDFLEDALDQVTLKPAHKKAISEFMDPQAGPGYTYIPDGCYMPTIDKGAYNVQDI